MQSGVSECVWNSVDLNCSGRPPSKDPIFTILVALLTTIVSIPILVLLHYILIAYCTSWPGSKYLQDEIYIKDDQTEGNKSNTDDDKYLANSEKSENNAYSSPFELEMKKALPPKNQSDHVTAGTIAQNAYAGSYRS